MKIDDVLSYYGSAYQFAKQTGMAINNIRNWRLFGYIPAASQMKLESLTNGALKASFADAVKNDAR
jgi:hypothetical protein